MVDIVTDAQRAAVEEGTVEGLSADATAGTEDLDSKPSEWEGMMETDEEADAAAAPAEEAPEELPASTDEGTEDKTKEEEASAEDVAKPEGEETPTEDKPTEEKPEVKPEETVENVEVPEELPEDEPKALTNEERQQLRTQAQEELVAQFTLNEEDAELMLSAPEQVLPKLAANMYLDIFDGVLQAMQTQMPHMIAAANLQQATKASYEQKFFNAWPQLTEATHRGTIQRITASFRDLNPAATEEEVIQEVGAQAWIALRLPVEELLAHTNKQTAPTQEIIQSVQIPAGSQTRSVGSRPVVTTTKNNFEQFSEEFDDD